MGAWLLFCKVFPVISYRILCLHNLIRKKEVAITNIVLLELNILITYMNINIFYRIFSGHLYLNINHIKIISYLNHILNVTVFCTV